MSVCVCVCVCVLNGKGNHLAAEDIRRLFIYQTVHERIELRLVQRCVNGDAARRDPLYVCVLVCVCACICTYMYVLYVCVRVSVCVCTRNHIYRQMP